MKRPLVTLLAALFAVVLLTVSCKQDMTMRLLYWNIQNGM